MSIKLSLNLNLLETMYYFWIAISSREKLSEKFINDIANDSTFSQIYNEEFSNESVRRSLSALSNREPFTGNKAETRFYSRNLMILEYIDTLQSKMNAFKALRLNELEASIASIDNELTIYVVPSPFETVQLKNNSLYLNFFKFNIIDGQLNADDQTIEQILALTIK